MSLASGTILFVKPNDANVTNDTYIVTSKEVLQLYNAGNARPDFESKKGGDFEKLIGNFVRDVVVVYGEELWKAPATPPVNTAPLKDIIFKENDKSWVYDLVFIHSQDQNLYRHAEGNFCWDATGWSTVSDIPLSSDIKELFAQQKNTLLTGFGDTPVPVGQAPDADPKINKTPFSVQFESPTALTVSFRARPLPSNSLQIQIVNTKNKIAYDSTIKFWPQPVPAGTLVMDEKFKAIRDCSSAALLDGTQLNSCVAGDTGGGVFNTTMKSDINKDILIKKVYSVSMGFVGVVSGVNGTTEGVKEWGKSFDDLKKEVNKKTNDLTTYLNKLHPYLPWPDRNQVITLITDMLDNWPLDWPPPPAGYFKSTQQPKAETFVQPKCNACTKANVSQALNDVFDTAKGKATDSKYNNINILHASAGDGNTSATIFYTRQLDGKKLISIQIVAIGHHVDAKSSTCKNDQVAYEIDWVLNAVNKTNKNITGTPIEEGKDYCLG